MTEEAAASAAEETAATASAVKDEVKDEMTDAMMDVLTDVPTQKMKDAVTKPHPTAKAVGAVNEVIEARVAVEVSAVTGPKKAAPTRGTRRAWTSAARNQKRAVTQPLKDAMTAVAARAARVQAAPMTQRRNNKVSSTPCRAQTLQHTAIRLIQPNLAKPAKAAADAAVAAVAVTATKCAAKHQVPRQAPAS